jgi:hypothetical protein
VEQRQSHQCFAAAAALSMHISYTYQLRHHNIIITQLTSTAPALHSLQRCVLPSPYANSPCPPPAHWQAIANALHACTAGLLKSRPLNSCSCCSKNATSSN